MEKELSERISQVKIFEEDLQAKLHELAAKAEEISKLSRELEDSKWTIDESRNKIAELTAALQSLEEAIGRIKSNVDSRIQPKGSEYLDGRLVQLQEQVKMKGEELLTAILKLKESSSKVEDQEKQIKSLQTEVEELNKLKEVIETKEKVVNQFSPLIFLGIAE